MTSETHYEFDHVGDFLVFRLWGNFRDGGGVFGGLERLVERLHGFGELGFLRYVVILQRIGPVVVEHIGFARTCSAIVAVFGVAVVGGANGVAADESTHGGLRPRAVREPH